MDRKKKFQTMKTDSSSGRTKIFLTVPYLPWMKLRPVRKNTAGHLWKVSVWKPITDFPRKPIKDNSQKNCICVFSRVISKFLKYKFLFFSYI